VGISKRSFSRAGWRQSRGCLFLMNLPGESTSERKAEVEKLIQSLRQEGLGVLFISSELEEVVRQSQRVVVLRDRRKVDELTEGEISEEAIMHSIATHNLERPAA
jgi:galactofuranose transport system ATP-binding protein